MVTRRSNLLSFSNSGLLDWFIQRVSAVIIASYNVFLFTFIIKHSHINYFEWKSLFHSPAMKVFTVLNALSLVSHVWIGLWIIFTDYVKCAYLRILLQLSVIVSLIVGLFYLLTIIWSV